MVLMHTPKLDPSFTAPDFTLPDFDGNKFSLKELAGQNGLVIAFIANHCPYVQVILDKLVEDAKLLQSKDISFVAMAASDIESYPQDGPDSMKILSMQKGFTFPYLFDESQDVARNYGAICTPDFFGFNADLELRYRGRLDASEMTHKTGLKRDLVDAMLELLETGKAPKIQHPSQGCSIKWK